MSRKRRFSVFLFFASLYVATTSGHIYTIDSYLDYQVAKSMGTRGELAIPHLMMSVEGRGGRYYSKLGVGQSLADLPLFWTGAAVASAFPHARIFDVYAGPVNIPHDGRLVSAEPQDLIRISDTDGARVFFTVLTNALLTAVVCLLFWELLRAFGLSRRGALWGAALLAFGTPFWIYARDGFAEPLFAACLLGAFLILSDRGRLGRPAWLVAAGLASAVGILARASFLPIAVIAGLYLLIASRGASAGLRRVLWYALGCLPGAIALGVLDLWRFGGLTMTGYHTAFDRGFSTPLARGLFWNLASPYRSIFIYAPAVAIFAFAIREFLRQHRREAALLIAIAAYIFILYSAWWAWHGGWCWGPRFLLPAIPLLLLPGLVAARTRRWLVIAAAVLGAVGFAVQLSGLLINYTAAYDYWIKIKKLDWSETNIQNLFPVSVQVKAIFSTSPGQYDLWLIQAARVIGWRVLWIAAALAAVAIGSAAYVIKPLRKS
jgi:hypothetical protein